MTVSYETALLVVVAWFTFCMVVGYVGAVGLLKFARRKRKDKEWTD